MALDGLFCDANAVRNNSLTHSTVLVVN